MGKSSKKTVKEMAEGSGPTAKKVKKTTVFNDAVHMSMEFSAPLVAIIHTPEMQRLKDIKQLGGVFMVYPAASHNRFEHSLGVCHLAGVMMKEFKDRQPELITDKDVLMVQIAGLCHDLGHGPFSHFFDKNFLPALRGEKEKIKHEHISRTMFEHMVNSNPHVKLVLRNEGITEDDYGTIQDLFHFDEKKYKSKMLQGKEFLYEIVANNRNGVDVDKWDYFKRDAKQLGMDTAFDHTRLMKFCSVIDNHICFRDKEAYNVYQMFVTRQVLHRQAYQHKTVMAVETMILNGLLAAADFIRIPYRLLGHEAGAGTTSSGPTLTELCSVERADDMNMDAYVKLTDSIYYQILASEDKELESARAWFQDLQKRKIYRLVAESPPINDEVILIKKNLEVEVRDAIVENVKKELESRQKALESKNEALESKNKALESKKKKLEREKKLKEKEKELENVEKELENVKEELENVKEELKNAKKDLENVEKDLSETLPFYDEKHCTKEIVTETETGPNHNQPCQRCPKYRFIVQTQRLDFVGKSVDPAKDISFYRKEETTKPVAVMAPHNISTFFPKTKWAEMKIRVLLHPSSDQEKDKKIHDLLLKGFEQCY